MLQIDDFLPVNYSRMRTREERRCGRLDCIDECVLDVVLGVRWNPRIDLCKTREKERKKRRKKIVEYCFNASTVETSQMTKSTDITVNRL